MFHEFLSRFLNRMNVIETAVVDPVHLFAKSCARLLRATLVSFRIFPHRSKKRVSMREKRIGYRIRNYSLRTIRRVLFDSSHEIRFDSKRQIAHSELDSFVYV